MRQQQSDFVSLLTEIKLNVKEGTHKTSVKIKVEEICTMPMCVTKACSPLGKQTKVWTIEVIEVN